MAYIGIWQASDMAIRAKSIAYTLDGSDMKVAEWRLAAPPPLLSPTRCHAMLALLARQRYAWRCYVADDDADAR